MHLSCPHCQNPIEIVALDKDEEVVCPTCGSSIQLDPGRTKTHLPNHAPRRLGKFEFLEVLGVGGFGTVYKARDSELGRTVAIKIPRAGNLATPEDIDRFLREGRAAAQLKHPSIVSIHDAGASDGICFLVSEYVAGETLADRLQRGRLGFHDAAELLAQVAEALEYAHQQGVVHRDLKPSNIMLDLEGKPHVMDFGLAKREAGEITVTLDGQVLGTPAYMSPEQARGEAHDVDARSDVYSLGVILYELLTGELPFRGNKRMLVVQVQRDEPRAPRGLNDHIPRDLETITLKCMAKEPARRYATARELSDDLRRWLRGEPIHARPVNAVGRVWRWSRRNPAVAVLSSAVFLSLVVGTAVASFFAYRANLSAHDAAANAERFLEQKRLSDRRLYATVMNLTQRLLEKAQLAAALDLLDSVRPERTDNIDLRGWEWYYLKRQCHSELAQFDGHTGEVRCVAISPDGQLVASGSDDRTVRIWNQSGQLLHTLHGHLEPVNAIAFSPDGSKLASASADSTVKLWNSQSGSLLLTYQGHVMGVSSVVFRRDGAELASAGHDATVRCWDLAGNDRLILQTHLEDLGVNHLAYNSDGSCLAGASYLSGVRVWNATSGEVLFHNRDIQRSLSHVTFHPDGRRVAVVGEEPKITILDAHDGKELMVLDGHASGIGSVQFSPDGKWLASGGKSDNVIKIWDVGNWMKLRDLKGHLGGVNSVCFSKDGTRLVSGSADRTVKLWDVSADSDGRTLDGHMANVGSLVFSPDGQRLVSGSADHSARIWNVANGTELLSLGRHTIELENYRRGMPGRIKSVTTHAGHTGMVRSIDISRDGNWVASAGTDGTLRIWNATSGSEENRVKLGAPDVRRVRFLSSGEQVAVLVSNDDLKVWDLSSKKVVQAIATQARPITDFAISRDGSLVATIGDGPLIRIWDRATGEERQVLKGHHDDVFCIQFNGDGTLLASGSRDRTARVWEIKSGSERNVLTGHSGHVSSVAFAPDNRRLFTAGGGLTDPTVKVWDLSTQQELLTLVGQYPPVVVSPDGNYVACSGGPWHSIKLAASNPVDAQPYRLAHNKPVVNDREETSEDIGAVPKEFRQLRVLGSFVSRQLPGGRDQGRSPVLRVQREDRQFLVVVLSVPHLHLIPTEAEYAEVAERQSRMWGKLEMPPRHRIAMENSKRFHLLLDDGRDIPASVIGDWPLAPRRGEGFINGGTTVTHHIPINPGKLKCFAIGWVLDVADCKGPWQVKVGDSEPASVPNLSLQPPPLPPPPKPTLAQRIQSAWDQAKKGQHAESVAEAEQVVQVELANGTYAYNAACVYSIAAVAVLRDDRLEESERKELREQYLVRAVQLLRLAVQKGFKDFEHLRMDEDLEPLRNRDDFKQFLTEQDPTRSEAKTK